MHVGAGSETDDDYGILRAKVPEGWLVATVEGGPEDVGLPEHYKPRGICFTPIRLTPGNLAT
jgi:hypothetical protein